MWRTKFKVSVKYAFLRLPEYIIAISSSSALVSLSLHTTSFHSLSNFWMPILLISQFHVLCIVYSLNSISPELIFCNWHSRIHTSNWALKHILGKLVTFVIVLSMVAGSHREWTLVNWILQSVFSKVCLSLTWDSKFLSGLSDLKLLWYAQALTYCDISLSEWDVIALYYISVLGLTLCSHSLSPSFSVLITTI